jgi:hypothetical protein
MHIELNVNFSLPNYYVFGQGQINFLPIIKLHNSDMPKKCFLFKGKFNEHTDTILKRFVKFIENKCFVSTFLFN